jgi:hypothetical protein
VTAPPRDLRSRERHTAATEERALIVEYLLEYARRHRADEVRHAALAVARGEHRAVANLEVKP